MSPVPEGDRPEFSVIVPTLDEEPELEETLRRARSALDAPTEFLIVDGGSWDRTVEIGRRYGRVIASAPGRGRQLDRGARAAAAPILLFLHADTWLCPGTAEAIRGAISEGVGVGCLRFAVRPAARDPRYRTLERGVNWRTERFATATGDQAIFVTMDVYEACGGFREIPLFEDVTFVRDARRIAPFRMVDLPARTSRRRWERYGFLRTVVTHWVLRAAFASGVDPHRLDGFYRRRP